MKCRAGILIPAELDSDGGGQTNGSELLDPNGDWTEGEPDKGDQDDVNNPGEPSDDIPGVEEIFRGQVKADQ